MSALLITGTDTNVGKTVFTSSFIAYWLHYHPNQSIGLMKLMQTGMGDHQLYEDLFKTYQSIEIVTPLKFTAPLAPPIAAIKEGKIVDLKTVWQAFCSLTQNKDFVIIEALGGLGSPVTDELTVADIAFEWRLDTVLVVPVQLGAIGAAVANVALARQAKINLKGIILNCVHPTTVEEINDLTPTDLIQSLCHVPILGIVPYLSEPHNLAKLTQIASNCDLELLLCSR
ncbi:ATP-dependent dethiobiotin synthetase BioD [Aphanothece hegewaldii CCALA 016]|uniref:ATP-dependent dethiobiotin synthetase BioD n=1 Tax=Aphanothece hegewaldii CCALA 016 TaxID=2107694 RepID=A0A2T1LZ31_9CHRO|nr:dethiobiotin synthase [Aphanothece hegewaldii]PSF37596.1 ATP-dependent dethiobiotin synthetase BioD [Aphanothece hegewaldii CCALA 016]